MNNIEISQTFLHLIQCEQFMEAIETTAAAEKRNRNEANILVQMQSIIVAWLKEYKYG